MRLLVLGGTLFLGRHVVTAALERGHDVATFTRGLTGAPPDGVRALHGDRDDPAALPRALEGWAPDVVVDTSCQTRAAARNAAAALAGVRGYAFVSSLNAYRNWPPGPIGPEDGEPTWDTDVLTGARALRLCTRRGLPNSPQMVLAAARSTPLPQVPQLPGRKAG